MGALACQTKIIIDGRGAAGSGQAIVDAAMTLSPEQVEKLTDDVAYPIIEQIIKAEHALGKACNQLLDAVGYDGPRPDTPYKHE